MAEFTGTTITFRSTEPYFTAERDGRKPNTLRQMTDTEYGMALMCHRVRIVGPDDARFEREITSVIDVNDVFGLDTCDRLAVISWKHNPKGDSPLTRCLICGSLTESNRDDKKWCSEKCRNRHNYLRRTGRWDDTNIYNLSDDDLPGMWSRSGFEGGQND